MLHESRPPLVRLIFERWTEPRMRESQNSILEKRSRLVDTAFLALCGAMSSASLVAGTWGAWATFGIVSFRVGIGKILPLFGCAVMIASAAMAARLSWTFWRRIRQLWQ